ncbi:MAG: hypothetical protein ACYDFU_06775 [Nitrospirota bacterium]
MDRPEKKKALDELATFMERMLGDNLIALYEFGEGASVDWEGNGLKILAVLNTLGTRELRVLSEDRRKWEKNGLPAPLMLTKETLISSADVFPMEYLEMKEANRFICGREDVLSQLDIPLSNLRLQLEGQAMGKLIHLRQSYIEVAGDKKRLAHLIAVSIEPFTEVMRNCLRLYGKPAPVVKEEIISRFCAESGIDPVPFNQALELRREGKKINLDLDGLEALFSGYLEEIRKMAEKIDKNFS